VKELREIVAAFQTICDTGGSGVLASIVHVEGSTYRRAGARLLVTPDDQMIGLISGGCLEGDLLERAQAVRATRTSERVRYDATGDDDLVWGLGLGCAGVVDVWLERVDARTPGPLLWLEEWLRTRTTAALSTATEGPRAGQRAALVSGSAVVGSLSGSAVEAELRAALESGRSRTTRDGDEQRSVEVFRPPLRIAVFGAGPDAAPLVRFGTALGWDLLLVDHRAALAVPENFPGAEVQCVPVEDAVEAARVDGGTYCIVMSHHYLNDRTLVRGLLSTASPYLALLGPKQRGDDLLADLAADGKTITDEDHARIFAPAGLDLGADSPETIALSITAEIQAVSANRSGGWLRDRKGPIHDPENA